MDVGCEESGVDVIELVVTGEYVLGCEMRMKGCRWMRFVRIDMCGCVMMVMMLL